MKDYERDKMEKNFFTQVEGGVLDLYQPGFSRNTRDSSGEVEELEIEFDALISRDLRFFEELKKLGLDFRQERRYCG